MPTRVKVANYSKNTKILRRGYGKKKKKSTSRALASRAKNVLASVGFEPTILRLAIQKNSVIFTEYLH